MNFSKDYQKAMYIFFFASLLLAPIQWEFKLLIASTIFLIESMITFKFNALVETLISIKVNTEILWQSRPEEDIDKAFNAMDSEDDNPHLREFKAKINKNVPSIRIERTPKSEKRIARAHDPIVTLSQNGYGICYQVHVVYFWIPIKYSISICRNKNHTGREFQRNFQARCRYRIKEGSWSPSLDG